MHIAIKARQQILEMPRHEQESHRGYSPYYKPSSHIHWWTHHLSKH